MDEASGQRIGPFRVETELARGGQGVVYRAVHLGTGQRVALKQLLDHDPSSLKRFVQEAEVLRRLPPHKNLVRLVDAGSLDGEVYLATELVEGTNLTCHTLREGPPTPTWIRLVVGQLAEALGHCHRAGVIHRDVKPDNVILRAGSGEPVLVDFGVVKRDAERMEISQLDQLSRFSRTGDVIGTPGYLPPEILRGERVDARADVYSLGGLLHFLLTRVAPFSGPSRINIFMAILNDPVPDPLALRPDADPQLAALARRCLAKDPGQRPASMEELAALLRPTPSVADSAPRRGRQQGPAALETAAPARAQARSWTSDLGVVLATGLLGALAYGALAFALGSSGVPANPVSPSPTATSLPVSPAVTVPTSIADRPRGRRPQPPARPQEWGFELLPPGPLEPARLEALASAQLERARQAQEEEDWVAAYVAQSQALACTPRDTSLVLERAQVALELGRESWVAADLARADRQGGDPVLIERVWAGLRERDPERWADPAGDARRATEALTRVRAAADEGQPAQARSELQAMRQAGHDYASGYQVEALLLRQEGAFEAEDMLALYLIAARLAPDSALAREELARLLRAAGRPGEALSEAEVGLGLAPEDVDLLAIASRAAWDLADAPRAYVRAMEAQLVALERAKTLGVDKQITVYSRALRGIVKDRAPYRSWRELRDRVGLLIPQSVDPVVRAGLAQVSLRHAKRLGDSDPGYSGFLNRALGFDPTLGEAYALRVQQLLASGEVFLAVRDLAARRAVADDGGAELLPAIARALRRWRERGERWPEISQLDYQVGRRRTGSASEELVARLTKIWPAAPGLLLRRAQRSQDLEEKIRLLSRAVADCPESAPLRVSLATRLLVRGLDAYAQAQLLVALQLEPEDPDALAALALVWQLAGESERSQALWQEARRRAHEQGGRQARLELGRRFEGLIADVRLGARRYRLPFNLPGGPTPR